MHCPRCQSELEEVSPNPKWLRHFICSECEAAWRLEAGVLVLGRNPSHFFDFVIAHSNEWSFGDD